MAKSYEIDSYINKEIKIGDKIKLIDGRGLTAENCNLDLSITNYYKDLLGDSKQLKDLEGVVIQTGIADTISVVRNHSEAYLQDIVIEINGVKFMTCSKFVAKVKEYKVTHLNTKIINLISQDFTVNQGHHLIIENSVLLFEPGIKLIVEDGAKLTIRSSILNSTENNKLWYGIIRPNSSSIKISNSKILNKLYN